MAAKMPMLLPMSKGFSFFFTSVLSFSMDLEASDMSVESLDAASFSS